MKKNVMVSWSSGKDSALTLARMLERHDCQVIGLMTTFEQESEEVPIQSVAIEAVRAQARACGLPFVEVPLPREPTNGSYQKAILHVLNQWPQRIDAIAFGDMYCNGIIEYRQGFLTPEGYECIFPLMDQAPDVLAQEVIDRGIHAFICSVDSGQLDVGFCGREYTSQLLSELPQGIDPCGEVGEFHTFVYDAPFYSAALSLNRGTPYQRIYQHSRKVDLMVLPFDVIE